MAFQRVFVIQLRDTGEFLSPELHWVTSLRAAGRLFDDEEARDTAHCNTFEPYQIHSFWEQVQDGLRSVSA